MESPSISPLFPSCSSVLSRTASVVATSATGRSLAPVKDVVTVVRGRPREGDDGGDDVEVELSTGGGCRVLIIGG